ncbi:HNH endonuclease [Actinoplanes sp. N902-109]|uniref:HNH endonuclease n=1 Tax=Actinoplanes sp. (strain N902-109) TaxID=649831 RepID=UPI0003295835|nr:hypothetical protein [Actinoplanes sp. N902-109]AGL21528.1 hypothetical protein L083_8018 [Actinoplanes sp. N902-109]
MAPGKRKQAFGDEQKIPAFLAAHVGKGGVFTMRMLRAALGEGAMPNDKEHLNRRLRTLRRRDGWTIASQRDDGSLEHDEYRVVEIGWHPGTGRARPINDSPSDNTRRYVHERDGRRCVICGIAAGEEYDDDGKVARLTLGHRVPGKRLTRTATMDELQTECSRCNESVRDELVDPPTLPQVLPSIRLLPVAIKRELFHRLRDNRRVRTRADDAHESARRLSSSEREQLIRELQAMIGER